MFNPDDYEDLEDPSSLIVDELLPPHVKVAKVAYHYEQQEKSVITVMRLGMKMDSNKSNSLWVAVPAKQQLMTLNASQQRDTTLGLISSASSICLFA